MRRHEIMEKTKRMIEKIERSRKRRPKMKWIDSHKVTALSFAKPDQGC